MRTRLLPACAFLLLAAPAVAQQAPARPASVTERLNALEKQNAALRQDVDRLQALLVQTRRDLLVAQGAYVSAGSAYTGAVGSTIYQPTIQPQSLASQQAQANAAIQAQGTQQQLNNLQLQQNLAQDRARDQQLFNPQPFGGTP
jgi:hypothetical protein